MRLADPIAQLTSVGPQNAKKLQKLGIFSVQDLLFHFPRRYDDLSKITPIVAVRPGADYVIRGKVELVSLRATFRTRMKILEALVSDGTGSIMLVWFNQPYLEKIFQKGRTFLFAGPVTFYDVLQMQNPTWQAEGSARLHVGTIVPVYDLTKDIFPKWLRTLIKGTLHSLPALSDYLPSWLVNTYALLGFDRAIRAIHFPSSLAAGVSARRRFEFEELLFYQIKALLHKRTLQTLTAPRLSFNAEVIRSFVKKLPFTLTGSQKRAAWEILQDLGRARPANRLLSGDVGSGKTIVAAIAALHAILAGSHVALMVPTEILARQHFTTLTKLPEFNRLTIGLLCASSQQVAHGGALESCSKKALLKLLEEKKVHIIIGTHALIQKAVPLRDLGLVIIDEQHRFGVQQRAFLHKQTSTGGGGATFPHFLSLTATPIPRTLALALYGDLDISRIDEQPLGRKPVTTVLVEPSSRPRMYAKINELVSSGQQAFVVCPTIDPSDTLGVKSVTEEYERLRTSVFPACTIGLLHGKLTVGQKTNVIEKFSNRKLDMLVSTTVVEVGVDFPNATIMLIEGAERFGLAQLHQLRGRVGRSNLQSYCFLVPSGPLSETAAQRLQALVEHHDGMKLAEIDLTLRGPGEVYGQAQSGYPTFKIADIFNRELLEQTRTAAEQLLANDTPRSPLLDKKIKQLEQTVHAE